MADHDDLRQSLRAVADRLDRSAPPLDPDAVRSPRPAPGRRSPRLLVAAAVVLVALAAGVTWQTVGDDDRPDEVAAGQQPTDATFPSGEFAVTSLVVNGVAQPIGSLHLTIDTDAMTYAADNNCVGGNGSIALEGDRIAFIEELGNSGLCTIPTLDGDLLFFRALSDGPAWQRTVGGLVLRTEGAEVTLAPVLGGGAFPTQRLQLTSIVVDDQPISIEGVEATLRLDNAAGALIGQACGGIGATVVVDENRIATPSGVSSSLTECFNPLLAVDSALRQLLDADPNWEATVDGVVLRSPTTTATFVLADPTQADGFPTGPLMVTSLLINGVERDLEGTAPVVEVSADGTRITLTTGCRLLDAAVTILDGVIDVGAPAGPSDCVGARGFEAALSDLLSLGPRWTATADGVVIETSGLAATLVSAGTTTGPPIVPVPTTPTTVPPTTSVPPITAPPATDESTLLVYLFDADVDYLLPQAYVAVLRPATPGDMRSRAEQAVRAYLAGPTAAEEAAGLGAFTVDLALVRSVTIEGGSRVVIDLDPAFTAASGGIGTSAGGSIFHQGLSRTIFALDDVDEYEIRVDGSCEAYTEFMQGSGCQRFDRRSVDSGG